jgi:murein DD-endopeptidase MepM/ murein hydrolase activator NlpD
MALPIAAAMLPTRGIRSYLYQRSDTHKHRGIDLPARIGTPVFAADDGLVEHATDEWQSGFSGYGRVVVLRHGGDNGPRSLYAHLDTVEVEPGEVVEEGERIGTVGVSKFSRADKTGSFTTSRAHLHFEVAPKRYPMGSEADRLDPVAWLLDGRELPIDPSEIHDRMKKTESGAEFLALLALFGGVLWLRRARGGR